jgi:hypothetical protein
MSAETFGPPRVGDTVRYWTEARGFVVGEVIRHGSGGILRVRRMGGRALTAHWPRDLTVLAREQHLPGAAPPASCDDAITLF